MEWVGGYRPNSGAAEEPAQPSEGAASRIVGRTTALAWPCLMAWTPAVLALGLRRPRLPRRGLLRRPGMAACAVATPVPAASAHAAHAVAGAWLIMALGGWWRADRHWLDRLGRAIGFAWHLLMTAAFVVW